jgi:dTDP-4-amino-4,6-dideoxygalactose transaminase
MHRRFFLGAGSALALTPSSGRAADGKPALLGGEPVRKKAWPSWPQTAPQDETSWLEALRACKWWRKEGHFVRDFEKAWAARMSAKHCLATANGTGALMASLHALEVGPKDEVIVSPYTFIATINAILAHYALPVFADTDPDTGVIDAGSIESRITSRTRCILPVHLGGNVADMDRIMEISKRRGIPVVEDACQAHLSEWRGRKVSTIGHLGCFSFQKFKNLPGGEAGAVITGDEALYRRAYGFHSHYRTPDEGPSDPAGCNGINLRLAEFQASILLNQLTRLEAQAKRREENAATLTSLLKDIPGVKPARMYEGCTRNAYHLYMLRYDAEAFSGLTRASFLKAVQAEGAPISAGYGALNRDAFLENTLNSRTYRAVYTEQDVARWRERNQCPANDRLSRDGMWISQSALLAGRADMEDIAAAVRKVHSNAALLKKM